MNSYILRWGSSFLGTYLSPMNQEESKERFYVAEVGHSVSNLSVLGLIGLSIECYADGYAHTPKNTLKFLFKEKQNADAFMALFYASLKVEMPPIPTGKTKTPKSQDSGKSDA
jgi:hypothetical protein